MRSKATAVQQTNVLDELIDNAIELPVGSQDLLLMMAKAMRYTRNCLMQEDASEQPCNPSKED